MPNMKDLKKMAQSLEVKSNGKLAKRELIREIQKAEGHSDCFARIPDCSQGDCLFRSDCMGAKA